MARRRGPHRWARARACATIATPGRPPAVEAVINAEETTNAERARTPGDDPALGWPRRASSRASRRGLRPVRSVDDRLVAGVAGGIAERLEVDPLLIRVALVVLTCAGGVGALLYLVAWATSEEGVAGATRRAPAIDPQGALAVALVVLGSLLLLRHVGLWFGDALVWPVAVAGVGSVLIWTRGSPDDRARLSALGARLPGVPRAAIEGTPLSPLRVLAGAALIAVAMAGFLAGNDALLALRELGLAVVAALVGLALVAGPLLSRMVRSLRDERRERIRSEERAELAAHLHDSVLQTLALIQRSADQPARTVSLARRQERELRAWLYQPAPRARGDQPAPRARGDQARPGGWDDRRGGAPHTLDAALETIVEEVEAVHGVQVELVVVGEVGVDDRVRALLGAVREALTNAAKHAGVTEVSCYVEVEPDQVVAFVRDRGVGFDPGAVGADRHGIAASIRARLARHGGHLELVSAPGEGTELELCVPRDRRDRRDPRAVPETDPETDHDPDDPSAPRPETQETT